MDRTQKWMGSVGCLGQIENIKRQSLNNRSVVPRVKTFFYLCSAGAIWQVNMEVCLRDPRLKI